MKAVFALIALLLWLLAVIAALALYGIGGAMGTTAHQIPATCLFEAADAVGLYVPPDGSILRSAGGLPFLGPVGILLIYAVPAAAFTLIANPSRFRIPPHAGWSNDLFSRRSRGDRKHQSNDRSPAPP